ncbi:hypothetical protein JB92DRAFT_2826048 [Gautieria morchelliformis]|nr:hypothetical protein JB92DRAFT_2826048 [Gautieria morchelliformis]
MAESPALLFPATRIQPRPSCPKIKHLAQVPRYTTRVAESTRALFPTRLSARPTPCPTTSVQGSSDDRNTMTKKLPSFAASLTDDKQTGQQPVASSSKSAVKAPPEALEALLSSKSNPTRPPGSASASRKKPSQKDQGSSGDVLHHQPSKAPRPSHQEPRRTRDHVDSPHKARHTVPTDTTLADKKEGKPISLREQTSKPDKGKAGDPLERGGQECSRMCFGTLRCRPQEKDLGGNETEDPDRAKSAGASSKPDKGKGVDPLERDLERPGMFKDGLRNAQACNAFPYSAHTGQGWSRHSKEDIGSSLSTDLLPPKLMGRGTLLELSMVPGPCRPQSYLQRRDHGGLRRVARPLTQQGEEAVRWTSMENGKQAHSLVLHAASPTVISGTGRVRAAATFKPILQHQWRHELESRDLRAPGGIMKFFNANQMLVSNFLSAFGCIRAIGSIHHEGVKISC